MSVIVISKFRYKEGPMRPTTFAHTISKSTSEYLPDAVLAAATKMSLDSEDIIRYCQCHDEAALGATACTTYAKSFYMT